MSNKTTSSPWNIHPIEKNFPVSEKFKSGYHSALSSHPAFPLQTFSALGGGDAPLTTNMPRVRNQLFTISTQSVLSSHSQLNVSYTTTSSSAGLNEENRLILSPTTALNRINDFNVDLNPETRNEEKPVNTEQKSSHQTKIMDSDYYDLESLGAVGGYIDSPRNLKSLSWKESEKTTSSLINKRCFHGSLENLGSCKNGNEKSSRNVDKIIKNRRRSAPSALPVSSIRCQMIEAANDLLHEENKSLTSNMQKTRKKLFITKIATCFALQALKRRGRVIKEMEAAIERKREQCAARLILHSLLLNCWRNTRRELDMKLDDNNELRKSVENFTLQVQVLRHVSNNERQKAQEKSKLIDSLNDEVRILKEENRIMRKEVEKMENELNSLQASTQNLTDENSVLTKEIKGMIEQRDRLSQSFERERRRSEDFGKENVTMKESINKVEKQLKEITEQRSHWQERAMTSESEAWELQLNLDEKNNSIRELKAACDALRQEKMDLFEKKSQLKANLDKTTVALQDLTVENGELTTTYELVKTERDAKATKIVELEKTLEATKKEFLDVERELLSFKLQNVRRRREWGNALYFIVSPVDAVRRKWTYCE